MRKSPTTRREQEEKFIDKAVSNLTDDETIIEDLHKYVKHSKWPILPEKISPSLAEGSNLNKGLNLPLKEYEWNSIDRHIKSLGIRKTEWIRYAMFRLLQEEQIHFLKHKDD